ncbi:MAG: type IV pilus assembly protein PilM [Patescibacteria group bacterium]|nr:type IV pilus assembly protein PilM [Patescibacteria group bacterium]
MGLFSSESTYVGIDIGSTSIKVVELKKINGKIALATYGFSENSDTPKQDWQKDIGSTAKVIQKIFDESGVIGRNSISALPIFSVFSSLINLSNVAKKDIVGAVHWEAKKVIPLPLEDMVLDWKIVDNTEESKDKKKKLSKNIRVLLTGAPKTLVKRYVQIFKLSQINLLSLETETFSLIRSLLGNDKNTVMIVEFGASTTDVTIIDKGIPMLNRSIDVGGLALTGAISKQLGVDYSRAEQFKYDLGISSFKDIDNKKENKDKPSVPKVISETLSPIVNEIKYAINLFQNKYNKNTEKIILSGGSSLLSDLVPYFSSLLDTKVIIGDPWSRVECPKEIKPLLREIGPRMSVAVGLALRELE